MRVLVTGGLGFIGFEVTQRLAERGDEVWVIDDLSSNTASKRDLQGAVSVIQGDAARYVGALRANHDTFDLLIHCASPVGPAGILKYRGRIASMIVGDTAAIITYCLATDTPLVNISTSEVYGFSGVYQEDDDLRVPAVPSARIEYALGKLAAEAECRLTPGLRSISVRPFNVAGARQSKMGGFVLPTFSEQAALGVPITVYGDGSQQRAFTSVTDLARFITDVAPDYLDGRVVNVGNPLNEVKISRLATRVREAAFSTSDITYTTGKHVHGDSYEEAEGHRKLPDISLAKSMGWTPSVTLDDLIVESVEHARRPVKAA